MGEHAEYALNSWIKAGMPGEMKRNKINRVECNICNKICHGQAGLMQHSNAKHGTKHTFHEVDMIRNKERYF